MKNKGKDHNPPENRARVHQHGRETVWRSKRREPITTTNRYPVDPQLDAENDTPMGKWVFGSPHNGGDDICRRKAHLQYC
jgi:hypothetical protein